jgi:hypothetical protein
MTSTGELRRKPNGAVLTIPLAASLVTLMVTEASLSGPTAIHWTLGGEPDNFASPRTAWAVTGGIGLAAGLLALALAILRPGRFDPAGPAPTAELVQRCAFAVAVLFSGLSVLVTGANLGGGEPRLPLVAVVAVLAACLLVAAAVVGPTTRSGRLDMHPTRPAGADALWEGRCRSRFAIPTFLVFLAVGVLLGVLVNPYAGAVLAVGGLCVLALVEITVLVTAATVQVCYSGPLRWPRTTLRLEDVARVEAITVEPMRYGGWGYRGSLRLFRRAAVNLRRGPGLRFELRDGRVFVLTVDDAEAAAATIRGLVGSDPSP